MKMHHYTYRITHIVDKKHYYGTRSSKVHPKEDLGIKYFSSSTDKEFIKDQKNNPHLYKYKVVKIFDSRKEAMKLEIVLHKKFNVGINESFYNKSKQTSTGFDFNHTGLKRSKEVRDKQSNRQLGVKFTQTRRDNISKSTKKVQENGKTVAQNRAMKGSDNPMFGKKGELNPFYGKTHSDETKQLLSIKAKDRLLTEETKKKISKSCSKPKANKENYAKYNYIVTLNKKIIFKDTSSVRVDKFLKNNSYPSFYMISKYKLDGLDTFKEVKS